MQAQSKRRHPVKKARRWVCRNGFNRFRKLPVRYGKPERGSAALNRSAAAIIVPPKTRRSSTKLGWPCWS